MGEMYATVPPVFCSGAVLMAQTIMAPAGQPICLPAELAGTEDDRGDPCTRGHGMDGIRELLTAVRDNNLAAGHFRGLLHVAIGRKITRPDGAVVSTGFTWRVLAQELKALRFDQEFVRELGVEPSVLAARDRERFWYSAIALAHVDGPEAVAAAEQLAHKLKALGYLVGPPPAALAGSPPPRARALEPKAPPPPPRAKEKDNEGKGAKKKKK